MNRQPLISLTGSKESPGMKRTLFKHVEQPLEEKWEANQSEQLWGIVGLIEILRKQNEEGTGGNSALVKVEKNSTGAAGVAALSVCILARATMPWLSGTPLPARCKWKFWEFLKTRPAEVAEPTGNDVNCCQLVFSFPCE